VDFYVNKVDDLEWPWLVKSHSLGAQQSTHVSCSDLFYSILCWGICRYIYAYGLLSNSIHLQGTSKLMQHIDVLTFVLLFYRIIHIGWYLKFKMRSLTINKITDCLNCAGCYIHVFSHRSDVSSDGLFWWCRNFAHFSFLVCFSRLDVIIKSWKAPLLW